MGTGQWLLPALGALGVLATLVFGWLLGDVQPSRGLRRHRIAVLVALALVTVAAGVAAGVSDGGARDDSGEPLTVSAQAVRACTGWFAPDPLEDVDPSAVHDGERWTDAGGSGPASPAVVMLTVQGTSDADVVLTGMEVEVIDRREPPAGVLLHDACGDAGAFRWLEVDLDAGDRPAITAYAVEDSASSDSASLDDGSDGPLGPARVEPVRFPYHVSRDAAESFVIEAYAFACDCAWTVSIAWQSEGDAGSLTVDDDGEPWRTVGLRNAWASCGVLDLPGGPDATSIPPDSCVTSIPEQERHSSWATAEARVPSP